MKFPELPGISFSVSKKAEELCISDNADSFGQIQSGCQPGELTLRTDIWAGANKYFAFTVDPSDKLRTPHPCRTFVDMEDGKVAEGKYYLKRIPVESKRTGNPMPVTYHQKNNIRILSLDKETFSVFTVAIIIQNSVAWLTVDLTYQAKLNDNVISCSPDRFWPMLFTWVGDLLNRGEMEAEPLPASKPDDDYNPDGYVPGEGLVLWWDSSLANAGSGCVLTKDGQMSAHWSQIDRGNEKRKFLRIGELVTYEKIRPRSGSGSGFANELVGVKPVNA